MNSQITNTDYFDTRIAFKQLRYFFLGFVVFFSVLLLLLDWPRISMEIIYPFVGVIVPFFFLIYIFMWFRWGNIAYVFKKDKIIVLRRGNIIREIDMNTIEGYYYWNGNTRLKVNEQQDLSFSFISSLGDEQKRLKEVLEQYRIKKIKKK